MSHCFYGEAEYKFSLSVGVVKQKAVLVQHLGNTLTVITEEGAMVFSGVPFHLVYKDKPITI
jgi:hypothetical protein